MVLRFGHIASASVAKSRLSGMSNLERNFPVLPKGLRWKKGRQNESEKENLHYNNIFENELIHCTV